MERLHENLEIVSREEEEKFIRGIVLENFSPVPGGEITRQRPGDILIARSGELNYGLLTTNSFVTNINSRRPVFHVLWGFQGDTLHWPGNGTLHDPTMPFTIEINPKTSQTKLHPKFDYGLKEIALPGKKLEYMVANRNSHELNQLQNKFDEWNLSKHLLTKALQITGVPAAINVVFALSPDRIDLIKIGSAAIPIVLSPAVLEANKKTSFYRAQIAD